MTHHPFFMLLLLFLIKTFIIVLAIASLLILFFALLSRGKLKETPKITIEKINDRYNAHRDKLQAQVLSKPALKQQKHAEKKARKKQSAKSLQRPRIYLLNFKGDPYANQVEALRETITAVLTTATPDDEVIVLLESPGGLVSRYGLAASQLQRIRDRHIPLTVSVDCVAASGGYMMACVANKILAAPFSIIGSIGVLVQLPNFHRFLQKHHIDFEQITAGQYKRTLSLFGHNSEASREKMQEEIAVIQQDFIELVKTYRPHIDTEKIATGEYWLGLQAKTLNLVDTLITSDDYLMDASQRADIFAIHSHKKRSFIERLVGHSKTYWRQLVQHHHPLY